MVELDDTSIGGKRKPGNQGHGATSKVSLMVAWQSSPRGSGHVALRKVASVTSTHARCFLTNSVEVDNLILSVGLSVYQPLCQGLNLYPLTLGSGQPAVEVFFDVHRVIAPLKTRIRGDAFTCIQNTLSAAYPNFPIVLIGGFNTSGSPSSTGCLPLAVQQRRFRIAN